MSLTGCSAGEVVLSTTAVLRNNATTLGGGVHVDSGCVGLVVDGGEISDNTAGDGGGVGLGTASDLTLQSSLAVNRNEATGGTGGGVLAVTSGSADLAVVSCTFEDNTAATFGGAIHVSGAGTAEVNGTTFTRSSSEEGGAVYGGSDLSLSFNVAVFTDCTATSGTGSAVFTTGSRSSRYSQ